VLNSEFFFVLVYSVALKLVKQGICVCVCVCMYACTHACLQTHTQTHSTHMYFSVCTCESAFVLTIVLCSDMCNEN